MFYVLFIDQTYAQSAALHYTRLTILSSRKFQEFQLYTEGTVSLGCLLVRCVAQLLLIIDNASETCPNTLTEKMSVLYHPTI